MSNIVVYMDPRFRGDDKNSALGIFLGGGKRNIQIERNNMDGNGTFDARDSTTGSLTAGTGNRWSRNNCDTDQPDGICNVR